MNAFVLDALLARDCHALGRRDTCRVLLMNNAAVPWFLLVPETSVTELYELSTAEQDSLRDSINALSAFIKAHFAVTKLNVAAIGNIVRQLHVHVVGRHSGDYCWPGVVWGTSTPSAYSATRVEQIRALVRLHLGVTP